MSPKPASTSSTPRKWLFPREHGAYGQLAYPLVCALSLGHVRLAALGFVGAALGLFFAHEPLIVLRGERGQRRLDAEGTRARWQLILWAALGGLLGLAALYGTRDTGAWMYAAPPAILGLVGGVLLLRGQERTTVGEVVIALAFASAALPVAAACGVPMRSTVLVSSAWGIVSSLHVLSVRGLLARGRANGSPRYAAIVTGVAGVLFCAMALAVSAGLWPVVGLAAIVPAVIVTGAFFAWPPPLKKLKAVGWTLMGSSTATLLLLVWLGRG